ncbi:hypothetical protein KM915_06665 [Cytobacillus oceanisediminis]|uniref:hypothetical protein n=1 Tax=Cytobacillus oceanisediminis TaxID=665099 RepID=UPI001C24DF34|nr:hypothetical protein [Cytobacillus oceanisediminis]MBU8729736.1 hypothetical protein [Cytobacillus oceanisediminis]
MKLEMGESLMLSWLRHIKHCQSVQLNWKPSNTWNLDNEDTIINIMEAAKIHFDITYNMDLLKKQDHIINCCNKEK